MGIEPTLPAWKAGTLAARSRAHAAEGEGVGRYANDYRVLPPSSLSLGGNTWSLKAFSVRHQRLFFPTAVRRWSSFSVASASKGSTVFETAAIAYWLALPQSCGGRNRTCVATINSRLPVPTQDPPQYYLATAFDPVSSLSLGGLSY